jgi:hypothetical protein
MGSHLIDGKFQSDKYPSTPRGKVPLSVKDPLAQPLLWAYAQGRRVVDAEFSDDLETALRDAGFVPPDSLKLDVYDEVRQEREVQDRKWGGPAHDDQHSGLDWLIYVLDHAAKSLDARLVGDSAWGSTDHDARWELTVIVPPAQGRNALSFRAQMKKVAGLAVAAMRWADRRAAAGR